MKKMLMDDDTVIIDGKEFTKEEIKEALVNQYRFNNLSNFLRIECQKGGVSNE